MERLQIRCLVYDLRKERYHFMRQPLSVACACFTKIELYVTASGFRNTWKDVVKRADSAHHQVSALGKACSKETSVQVHSPHVPYEFQSHNMTPTHVHDMSETIVALLL